MDLLKTSNEVYTERYYLKQYNDSYFRIIHCRSVREKGFVSCEKEKSDKNEVERCSLSRTKRNIRELAFCNPFTWFVTLTIASNKCDRFSLDEAQEKLRKRLKAYKRKNKKLIYLFITEKHQNGAFHFHGLMGNLDNFETDDLYVNKYGYISSDFWDKSLGYNSFSKIKDFNKCCNYITKYVTKKCVKNTEGTIYISSRGLKKADKYELESLKGSPIHWQYENDFVQIKDSFNMKKDEIKNLILTLKEK